ncbi:MAG: hypothetical protein CM1200mP20_03320 [Pseudomonadota bacterium]|nr:MAG: hypothetical protein CM1200mP20_03320 [Pseudomonadota bacterium]
MFAFATKYEPLAGAGRHATGTPAVIADEIFFCAAEIWQEVDQNLLWAKHQALGDLTIELLERECGPLGLRSTHPATTGSAVVTSVLAIPVPDRFPRPYWRPE